MILQLEGNDDIPKDLSEFIGRNNTKSNAQGNEPHTMTKVEATADIKQCFDNLTSTLDDAKK